MPAEISVIIPTLNAESELPGCLEALMEGMHAGLIHELIITDGGSEDATLTIADEVGARIVQGSASRGGQLRRGSAAARSPWLLVLHADTQLDPGWSKIVGQHIARSGAGPACFRLRFRATGIGAVWVAGWANLRTRLFGLPYGDQGLLVTRQAYEAAGGYPDQPLMEDVALVRKLSRVELLQGTARTGAERYQVSGWATRGARNLWTLLRYFCGTDPQSLANRYRKR